jgi:DNA repair exonuclease SbcCD ATPase subunit
MTPSKEKTFLDWLFGSSTAPEAPITVQVGGRQLRLEELQDEIERERASSLAELEAVRLSRTEAEAAQATCQAELERVNRELVAMKAALDSSQAEVKRLSLLTEEARTASVRDAEVRRKLSGRCSTLQFEVDKLRSMLEAKSKREAELEQAAERATAERAELEAATRSQLGARQEELEQRQKELSLARADAERYHKELKRQQATFLQASGRQLSSLESERRAWAAWLGHVWNALLYTLGPAAPLALETYLGDLEPVGHAATTEAAEARLREFLAARALCRNVSIVEQQSELRLELEPGPALEGTAIGWIGILATRQLATMLQRPLCTRGLEQSDARLTVHTTSRAESAESTLAGV